MGWFTDPFFGFLLDLRGTNNQTEVEDEYKEPGTFVTTLFFAGDIIAIISGISLIWMKYLMRRKFAHKTGLKEKVFSLGCPRGRMGQF